MVEAVRKGRSLRWVAKKFGVGVATVHEWVWRARGRELAAVDWEDRPSRPRKTRRVDRHIEDRIIGLRQGLKERSDLGEYGAVAIRRVLQKDSHGWIPSARTIGNILERRGALDGRRRPRRPPPPAGWYIPKVSSGDEELDLFDFVEDLAFKGGKQFDVLNGISLHGGLVGSWPDFESSAKTTVRYIRAHWSEVGRPGFAQFDNDTRFAGVHGYRDVLGRVVRFCLAAGVTPVFAPPREMGFQAAIEAYNGRWQHRVWQRFRFRGMKGLRDASQRFVAAYRQVRAPRIASAPPRRPWKSFSFDLDTIPHGRIIWIRRTDGKGFVQVLGHRFRAEPQWTHRLTRAEVNFDTGLVRIYALRRRAPHNHPLLNEVPYTWPARKSRSH